MASPALAAPLRAIVTRTIESTGNVGTYNSLALDANYNPVVAYSNNTATTSLRLAYCQDPTCTSITTNTVDSSSTNGFYLSLKLNSSGNPVITYRANNGLRIAYCSTPTCEPGSVTTKQLVSAPSASFVQYTSLQFDSSGNPVISYSRTGSAAGTRGVWLVRCDDPLCDSFTGPVRVYDTLGATYTSLQVNSSDIPVIAFQTAGTSDLYLTRCLDTTCTTQNTPLNLDGHIDDIDSNAGQFVSLALDSNDYAVISYYVQQAPTPAQEFNLKLIRCNNASCSSRDRVIVLSTGTVGAYSSMVLNSLGNPVISHRNGPTSEIMVVTCTNPTCTSITETAIDNSPGALATTSIALDCNDNPVVSYYQQTPADLKLGVDSPGCAAGFSSTPAAGSTLLLESAYTTPAQDTISVSSVGDPNFPLDVTFESITPGYQVLSGLPISGLLSTDPAATITVQCDSSPHPDGALVLNTSDPAQPTVTFNLECDAILPELTGAPAAPGPLAFSALPAASAQLNLSISNTGNPGTLLDVSLASIDSGYSIISGLPIDDLGTAASPIAITVQCDSAPQAAGTLVLNTNNPLEPTVSYDLTCTALEAQFGANPTPPGPLDFVDLPASSPQLSIEITNTGMAGSLLNVDVSSPISAGYTVLSGLPIASLPAGNSATVIIECSSVPQLDGALELTTNDPLQPTVSYDLTCTALEAQFSGSPAAPGPLVFVDGALQLDIGVSNSGATNSQLDVSLASITPGYTVVSGLPISGLLAGDPPEIISVQCDSLPQAAGALMLNTNDAGQSTVTYNLTCTTPSSGSGSSSAGEGSGAIGATAASANKPIAATGNTTLQMGRIWVSVPASAIPGGQSDCRVELRDVGDSGEYGFTLDDTVWDVKVICASGELSIFLAPLTICIQPPDGVSNNKLVYHSHNGGSFKAMSSDVTRPAYVCGQTRVLSLFTLGQLALPNTGFAPGRVSAVPAQPAEQAYAATTLTLSIPKLGVELNILGVPQGVNGWDVSWLGASQAGYLYGTAFPTWQGNSVLTAHVWNADNTPGPFYALKSLQHGDQFSISAYGHTYTYEVRSNQLVSPSSLRPLADSDYSLVTLITCESFDDGTGEYRYRRAVQAVLVDVH